MLRVRDSIPDIYFIITSEPALGLTLCSVQSFDRPGRCVKLFTHLHLIPKIRIHEAYHYISHPYPYYFPLFQHPNKIWQRIRITKLRIMYFSFFYIFLSHSSNILPRILFSNTLGLCSSLNVNNQVSYQENVVLLILVVSFKIGDGTIKFSEMM